MRKFFIVLSIVALTAFFSGNIAFAEELEFNEASNCDITTFGNNDPAVIEYCNHWLSEIPDQGPYLGVGMDKNFSNPYNDNETDVGETADMDVSGSGEATDPGPGDDGGQEH